MTTLNSKLRRIAVAMLAPTALALGACGDDDPIVETQLGDLNVTVAVAGPGADPDGFTVTLDGDESLPVPPEGGTVDFPQIPEGDHTVLLGGVAQNCTVGGENPRTVSVSSSQTATVEYTVTCQAAGGGGTGSLEVSVATTGDSADIDADGYTVSVDGGAAQTLAVNDTLVIDGLAAGDHEVQLGGVAANCTVAGTNPLTVTVAADDTVAASFTVDCAAAGATGDLTITTATTGDSIDSDGYTVTVDAGTPDTLAVNDTLTITGLAEGEHVVQLSGVAVNCTVSPAATDTVTVVANDTVTSAFDIACVEPPAATGAIRALTTTTGDPADADPDGYTVTVDAGTPDSIGVNDTLVVANLPTGDHDVSLGDLATNCTTSDTTLTVTVAEGDTIDAAFTVDCAATGGGGLNQIVFHSDRDGDLEILIINPDGTGLDTLTNNAGDDQLPAISPDSTKIAFVSDRGGSGNDIWVMDINGLNPIRITTATSSELWPAWSPNGTQIVFSRVTGTGGFDLFIVASDGSGGATPLTSDPADETNPDWSSNGRIAFDLGPDGNKEIAVINPDGTGLDTLTSNSANDARPKWSPDGTQIAFDTNRDGFSAQIYVMGADGSGQTRITNLDGATDFDPAWSPDGSQIAFASKNRPDTSQPNGDIFIMNADGSGITPITSDAALDAGPNWGQ